MKMRIDKPRHDCAALQIESLVTTRVWLFTSNISDLIIGYFYIAIRLQIWRFTIKYVSVRKMRYGHSELSKTTLRRDGYDHFTVGFTLVFHVIPSVNITFHMICFVNDRL